MKTEITFWLPLQTTDPKETKSVTLMLHSIPRIGELIDLHVRISPDEKIARSVRVVDIHRHIKYHPDRGEAFELINIFTE